MMAHARRREAALISCVDGDAFARSMIMAALGGYLLQRIFSGMGLSLWDMKWEIAKAEADYYLSANKIAEYEALNEDHIRNNKLFHTAGGINAELVNRLFDFRVFRHGFSPLKPLLISSGPLFSSPHSFYQD